MNSRDFFYHVIFSGHAVFIIFAIFLTIFGVDLNSSNVMHLNHFANRLISIFFDCYVSRSLNMIFVNAKFIRICKMKFRLFCYDVDDNCSIFYFIKTFVQKLQIYLIIDCDSSLFWFFFKFYWKRYFWSFQHKFYYIERWCSTFWKKKNEFIWKS